MKRKILRINLGRIHGKAEDKRIKKKEGKNEKKNLVEEDGDIIEKENKYYTKEIKGFARLKMGIQTRSKGMKENGNKLINELKNKIMNERV